MKEKTVRKIGWVLIAQFGTAFAGLFWYPYIFITLGLAIIGILIMMILDIREELKINKE